MQRGDLRQPPCCGVAAIGQPIQQAFDQPFRHGFPRMLPGNDPYRQYALAPVDSIQRASFHAVPQRTDAHIVCRRGAGKQIQMALVSIRREIRVIHIIMLRAMAYGQHLPVIIGRNAEPVMPVIARHSLIILPAIGIGTIACIQQTQSERSVGSAMNAEIKPLTEFCGVISPDIQLDIAGIGCGQDFNRTGIELTGN
ncbi:hypothetical protein GALL_515920 [mine drainage metagenome]|uniref:Uncharacterized protein n=1 Tax=mine drainage metagenome TaxID=410659 RepID=A0A1J5P6K0_9ZZZZ